MLRGKQKQKREICASFKGKRAHILTLPQSPEKKLIMTTKELKDKYRNEFYRIQKLINDFDPCGLIQSGAPDDEYDCLTNHLINMTIKGTTIEELKNLISTEMTDHFGVDIPTSEPYKSNFQKDLHEFAISVRHFDKYTGNA